MLLNIYFQIIIIYTILYVINCCTLIIIIFSNIKNTINKLEFIKITSNYYILIFTGWILISDREREPK